jgi:methylglyoxal/glyoxal reductase
MFNIKTRWKTGTFNSKYGYHLTENMDISSGVTLNNGVKMPFLGLGVFQLEEGEQVENAVKTALINGYRSIDTAYVYHNEEGVGKAIKTSGVPREEIFITTKVGLTQQGYNSTKEAFYQSLRFLQTDYLDLYLIHWPQGKLTLETWKAMEELYAEGLIRAIGVSNHNIHHLQYLLSNSKVTPAVNQIEFHPQHSQPQLQQYCRSKNIQVVAWSPLRQGTALAIPEIKALARRYKKTPVQIILRWNIQKGVVTIPKSGSAERIISNSKIFDFELSEADMLQIDNLNQNQPMVTRRDRIIHLLEMLRSEKFDLRLLQLLSYAVGDRLQETFNFKTSG